MKKFAFPLLAVLGFTLFSGTAFGYAEEDTQVSNPSSFWVKSQNNQKLENAIWRRMFNMYRKHDLRNDVVKNRLNQRQRHQLNKKANNTNERSTQMNRKGAMTTTEGRQEFANPSMIRPNSTQVFKKRAINYYVEGGNAGTKELRDGVIYGSQHRASRIPSSYYMWRTANSDIISERNAVQRDKNSWRKAPNGTNRFQRSKYRGNYQRNFWHPYMPAQFEDVQQ